VLGIFVVPKISLAIFHSSQYGKYLKDAISYFALRPFDLLYTGCKFFYSTFIVYVANSFFLSLFCPIFLLPIIGSIPVFIFRNDSSCIFTNLAFVYLSIIFGIKYLISRNDNNKFKKALGILLIFSSCISHYLYHFSFIDRSVGIIPFSRGFSIKNNLPTKRNKLGLKIIQSIPRNSSCFTIKPLAERLGNLKTLGVFGLTPFKSYEWEYCFFSTKNLEFTGWRFDRSNYINSIREILKSNEFKVQIYQDGWLLLKRAGREPLNQDDINSVLSGLNG
jgi:hypothetical protein